MTLEIGTNGTIKPDDAVTMAAKILIEHFNMFVGLTEKIEEIETPEEKEKDEREKDFGDAHRRAGFIGQVI